MSRLFVNQIDKDKGGPRGQNVLDDYFIERPIFPEWDFHRRYRMSTNLFNRLKIKLCNLDVYWHQRCDAIGVLDLLPEQKMTCTIQMLAYGLCADQCVDRRDHKDGQINNFKVPE
ncbi:hypothetical protein QQ045_018428 [Rhodiola kirilowii]